MEEERHFIYMFQENGIWSTFKTGEYIRSKILYAVSLWTLCGDSFMCNNFHIRVGINSSTCHALRSLTSIKKTDIIIIWVKKEKLIFSPAR
jgi:hypothetical protein